MLRSPSPSWLAGGFIALLLTVLAPGMGWVPGARAQQFGGSLAVAGDQVLIGESGNRTLSGIIYVYADVDGEWSETSQIQISTELRSPDGFGQAFSVSEDWLIAGAPLLEEGAGAAYAFRRDSAGAWSHVARVSPGTSEGGRFGAAVVAQGDVAVISAPGAAGGAGKVYVFRRAQDGTWAEEAALASPAPDLAGFGQVLALDGNRLLAGTRVERGAVGAVYAFESDGSRWLEQGQLVADDLPDGSAYGTAVGLAGDVAFVGAPGVLDRQGAVYVFERDRIGVWRVENELGPLVAGRGTGFGSSLDARDGRVAVGAPGAANGAGAVYELSGSGPAGWTGAAVLSSYQVPERGAFGRTAVFGPGVAVVGATGVDANSGAAVIYGRGDGGAWSEQAMVMNDVRGFPSITGEEIHCVEGQADLFECKDVNVIAFLPIGELGGSRGTRVNDIWGWTDAESGREYAIVGRSNGTSFVDITDPYNPVFLGDLPMTEGSRDTIWRDMKVYKDHVYVVADNALEHGVQVFDLRQLREVRGAPVTFQVTYLYDGIHSAHNIVINEETGFAYAVGNSGGGETCGGGLHMIDLEVPSRPVFAGCFAESATGRRRTGYSHDAQCVIYNGPDEQHQGKEVCFGSNETALNIADVTDKAAPVSLSTASYPNVAYAHQGWLTEDHRYFYMNDEGDEPQGLVEGTRTLVWDVTDLDDPILVKEHIATTTATDHNLYVRGDLMYQSNYSAGLRILDVSEPENPVEIGFFDTSPYEGGASWSNYPFFESGVIAVTGTGDGLFLLKNMARRNLIP